MDKNKKYPTPADLEQSKKDMLDVNVFVNSEENTFIDSSGKTRYTMTGLSALVQQKTASE